MLTLTNLIGLAANSSSGAAKIVSTEALETKRSTSDLTTYTFSDAEIGDNTSGRWIVLGITGRRDSSSQTISSVTVAGISATIVRQEYYGDAKSVAGNAIVEIPQGTGTTGDIVVTFTGGMQNCVVQVLAVYTQGDGTLQEIDGSTVEGTPYSDTVQVGSDGLVFASHIHEDEDKSKTWTGVDELSDRKWNTNRRHSFAARGPFGPKASHYWEVSDSSGTGVTVVSSLQFTTQPLSIDQFPDQITVNLTGTLADIEVSGGVPPYSYYVYHSEYSPGSRTIEIDGQAVGLFGATISTIAEGTTFERTNPASATYSEETVTLQVTDDEGNVVSAQATFYFYNT